jgi:hypothetical protein
VRGVSLVVSLGIVFVSECCEEAFTSNPEIAASPAAQL